MPDLSLIAAAVERSPFLRHLGEGYPEVLSRSFPPIQYGPGDTIAEGAEGTAVYIVAGGQLSVSQCCRPLCPLWPGDVFGQLALLRHCRRPATVQALSPVRLWAIDRQWYHTIATSSAMQHQAEIPGSLRCGVLCLPDISDSHLCTLLDTMEECTFTPGHVIIHEGDEGENFYLILKGEVQVSRREAGQRLIHVLGPGKHFVELAVLQ
ncbi:LOW QUALITY PROTEIN: cGMP-dependent protein kinase 1-like [Amazona ochrocephala]